MARRELLEPTPGDKRFVRRSRSGKFTEVVDVGRSLAADRRKKAKATAKSGMGDRGDRRPAASKKAGRKKAAGKPSARKKASPGAAAKTRSKARKKAAPKRPASKSGGMATKAKKIASRVKEAVRRDYMQTKNDLTDHQGRDLGQDAADTVEQAIGTEPLPPRDEPT